MGSRKNIQHRAGGGDVKVIILIFYDDHDDEVKTSRRS